MISVRFYLGGRINYLLTIPDQVWADPDKLDLGLVEVTAASVDEDLVRTMMRRNEPTTEAVWDTAELITVEHTYVLKHPKENP